MAFLTKAANRGSIATGYDIENSLKFESDNLETLYAVPWSSAGTRTTHTWSIWVKRTELGTRQMLLEGGTLNTVTGQLSLSFQTNDALEVRAGEFVPGSVAGTVYRLTNRVFRDTSAWYHIVAAFDTTQATANNRIKIWINGVQETSFATIANPAQNTDLGPFAANAQQTVGVSGNNGFYYNGYITHAALVYNQQLDADSFGEFDSVSGIWKPIDLEDLTFGAFGFWLKFENSSSLGTDSSGNNYGFTRANISSTDQATDTPTNNFCTFNPLMDEGNSPTITEGAMKSTGGGGNWNQTWGTIGTKNGKWYYEMKVTNTSSTGYFGASTTPAVSDYTNTVQLMYNTSFMVGTASGIDYYYWQNGSQTSNEATGWGNLANNDVLGLALDLDASTKKFYLYKNGSLLNSGGTNLPTNMQDEFIFPLYVQYENRQDEINFGGYTISSISSAASDANGYGTFEYAPPSGYYALCTKNLAQYGG